VNSAICQSITRGGKSEGEKEQRRGGNHLEKKKERSKVRMRSEWNGGSVLRQMVSKAKGSFLINRRVGDRKKMPGVCYTYDSSGLG